MDWAKSHWQRCLEDSDEEEGDEEGWDSVIEEVLYSSDDEKLDRLKSDILQVALIKKSFSNQNGKRPRPLKRRQPRHTRDPTTSPFYVLFVSSDEYLDPGCSADKARFFLNAVLQEKTLNAFSASNEMGDSGNWS